MTQRKCDENTSYSQPWTSILYDTGLRLLINLLHKKVNGEKKDWSCHGQYLLSEERLPCSAVVDCSIAYKLMNLRPMASNYKSVVHCNTKHCFCNELKKRNTQKFWLSLKNVCIPRDYSKQFLIY